MKSHITKQIVKNQEKNHSKIPAFIASFFSVLFSMSLIRELANYIEVYVLVFLSIFIFLFLIYNEQLKVKSWQKVWLGKLNSLFVGLITFAISVGLSGIGIYFWTNKSQETVNHIESAKQDQLTELISHHQAIEDSLLSLDVSGTVQYKELSNQLDFWKSRRPADLDERTMIRQEISSIQIKLDDLRRQYQEKIKDLVGSNRKTLEQKKIQNSTIYSIDLKSQKKNDFLTYIFLSLIIITEFVIISMARQQSEQNKLIDSILESESAKYFTLYRKMLSLLYVTRKKGDKITINDVKYMPIENLQWSVVKHFFNLLNSLDIIVDLAVEEKNESRIVTGVINCQQSDAIKKFDQYFETVLS